MTRTAPLSRSAQGLWVPRLENGDHLTREEFERRWDATPGLKRAELIEGVVYMSPPALRWDYHGRPHASLMGWLWVYSTATTGVAVGDNCSTRLDLDNEPQPDVAMIIEPKSGGQSRISDDGYLEGAPEFIGEVTASTKSLDMNQKLRVYLRNGVREYLVWRVQEQAIDWFALREGRYVPIEPRPDGIICSTIFPGLWLDPAAMIGGQMTTVLQVLQYGLATAEHAAFVAQLQARAAARPSP